jgi:hypothetical protein
MDSFDGPKPDLEEEKKELEKKKKREFSQWQKRFCEAVEGKWFEFDHPQHGKVKGLCEMACYEGLTEVGSIPDFTLWMKGRTGQTMKISLVENKAQECSEP